MTQARTNSEASGAGPARPQRGGTPSVPPPRGRSGPPSGGVDAPGPSGIVARIRRIAASIQLPSWCFSLVVHVAALLILACLYPERQFAELATLSLKVTLAPVEDSEASFEPAADIEPDISELTGSPDPEQPDPSVAAMDGLMPEMINDSIETVDTAPEMLFTDEAIEATPDAETLIAETRVQDFGMEGQGSSSFVGEIDGGDLASFFGVQASGSSVVYVVDSSSSMTGPPLERLKKELIDSIRELPEQSRFTVVFFNSGAIPFEGKSTLIQADVANKARVIVWIEQMQAQGGTDPQTALADALDAKPSAVFLMTDGAFTYPFDKKLMNKLSKSEQARTRVNTIAFGENAAKEPLQEIARNTGGTFAYINLGGNAR